MSLTHRLVRMSGRDPAERHRAPTPLELLFDLTFVVSFSVMSSETAHVLEAGHWAPGIAAFVLSAFAVGWAWVNYSWLASAYDNDDLLFRLATLVEMIGVVVIALGLPPFFRSIEEGQHVDNSIMVAGYVVMRVAAIVLWLRAARDDPEHRRACLAYAAAIAVAQVGWVALIFLSLPVWGTFVAFGVLTAVELTGPIIAETRFGGTPWHPHHLAERYSLLVIITLGEIVFGTVLAVSAAVDRVGWSPEAVLIAFSGTALAFGMWWLYFTVPVGRLLARHRGRAYGWSYGHIVVFASVAGTGAGLHVAATFIAGEARINAVAAVLTVVIPVLVYELMLLALYLLLLRSTDPLHLWAFATAALVLAGAVVAVASGASIGIGLLLVACSPALVIVLYETVGYRNEAAALERQALE